CQISVKAAKSNPAHDIFSLSGVRSILHLLSTLSLTQDFSHTLSSLSPSLCLFSLSFPLSTSPISQLSSLPPFRSISPSVPLPLSSLSLLSHSLSLSSLFSPLHFPYFTTFLPPPFPLYLSLCPTPPFLSLSPL